MCSFTQNINNYCKPNFIASPWISATKGVNPDYFILKILSWMTNIFKKIVPLQINYWIKTLLSRSYDFQRNSNQKTPKPSPPPSQKATLPPPPTSAPHLQPSQHFIRKAIINKISKHPIQHRNCFQLYLRKQHIWQDDTDFSDLKLYANRRVNTAVTSG